MPRKIPRKKKPSVQCQQLLPVYCPARAADNAIFFPRGIILHVSAARDLFCLRSGNIDSKYIFIGIRTDILCICLSDRQFLQLLQRLHMIHNDIINPIHERNSPSIAAILTVSILLYGKRFSKNLYLISTQCFRRLEPFFPEDKNFSGFYLWHIRLCQRVIHPKEIIPRQKIQARICRFLPNRKRIFLQRHRKIQIRITLTVRHVCSRILYKLYNIRTLLRYIFLHLRIAGLHVDLIWIEYVNLIIKTHKHTDRGRHHDHHHRR